MAKRSAKTLLAWSLRTVVVAVLGAGHLGSCYLTHERRPPGAAPVPAAAGAPAPPPIERSFEVPAVSHPPLPEPPPAAEPARCSDGQAPAVALDVLFVIDDSSSMREEQAALARELPRLFTALTAAPADGDVAIGELHLGVVSTDMGVPGVMGIPACDGQGDDGRLQHFPTGVARTCEASYPSFVRFEPGVDAAAARAHDFACIATLGTEGCGFEQQLEAGLKALWPARDVVLPSGGRIVADQLRFMDAAGGLTATGHGDGDNAGLLRHGLESVIAVVLVTDEDDCSSVVTRHFTPGVFLPPGDPLIEQDLNLRCFLNPQALHHLDRYFAGLSALRPGLPHHVFFSAIAGVPVDLVDAGALSALDPQRPESFTVFYDRILADDRMRERVAPSTTPEQGERLAASCETDSGRAFPPRRIVQLARRFGPDAMVQSICQDDFGPALDAIRLRLLETASQAACSAGMVATGEPQQATP